MATKLFVGSLSYGVTDDDLRDFFAAAGTVSSAQVIMDRDTNRSKGFGFVEMATPEEAQAAIAQLNRKELDGREVIVSEARPREDRPQRSFSGDRSGGYNRNGGGQGGFRPRRSF